MRIEVAKSLGNPGKEYEETYHNVGSLFRAYFNARRGKEIVGQTKSFMNVSGESVGKEMKKHKAKPEALLIVHDDSDISLGEYKISFDKNSGGHKGVESIIETLGTKAFWRLRIGIRPPTREGEKRKKAGEFVLQKISELDKKTLERVFEDAAEDIEKRKLL